MVGAVEAAEVVEEGETVGSGLLYAGMETEMEIEGLE